MEEYVGKYNIKAASKMVEIQPETLRAWERRYQMIAPVRNQSGHRLYTEEQINTLKWLTKKVNQGFTISQAVSLLENNQLSTESIYPQEESQLTSLSKELFISLIRFNETKVQETINSLFGFFTMDKVLLDVFEPILLKIGDLWQSGEITSAHEHFASTILQSRIGMIFHNIPQSNHLPKAIALCSPGERHEIGLLMFSLFLRRKGFDVVYLGSSISEEDIETVIKMIHPDFLFLSCTLQDNLTMALSLVTELELNYKNLSIGIGGNAIRTMKQSEMEQFSRFIVGQSLTDWEKWLPKRLS